MTTSLNSSVPARDYASAQLVHYLRKAINVLTTPAATVVNIGTLPPGALVLAGLSGVFVTADFTGTTNVVDIGYATDGVTSADGDAYATDLTLALTTGGFVAIDEMAVATGRPRTLETKITATWAGTASTGAFEVIIAYVPNR